MLDLTKAVQYHEQTKSNLRHRIVVDVNNLVQVPDNDFGDRCKLFEVKGPFWGDIHVESNRCQVAHCDLWRQNTKLILNRILNN